MASSVGDGGP
jgi:hypothetical protein